MPNFAKLSYGIYRRLAAVIAPAAAPTQHAYRAWLEEALFRGCDWLDLGCGHQILPEWVRADEPGIVALCRRAVGIDLDFPSLRANRVIRDRILGDLSRLPLATERFDLVTANMVFEHLERPLEVLGEIRRVLKPGGRLLVHTPNRRAPALRAAAATPEVLKKPVIRVLEQRAAHDVFPTFYRINSAGDIRSMAAQAGLRVERLEHLSSAAATAVLGPLAVPELLMLRMFSGERLAHLRSNILFTLRK